MNSHPDLILAQVDDYRRRLVADAERSRVLRAAKQRRRAQSAARRRAKAAAGKETDGNLAACGERAPAPVQ